MKKWKLSIMLSICSFTLAIGQNERYSLYYFANSAVNPAKINENNRLEASSIFRSQRATDGTDLTTMFLDISYPFFKNKKRWSSLGVSVGSDRSGIGGVFRTDEGRLNYAITLILARPHILSFGTSIRYVNTIFNTDRLFTGSQFVEGVGFSADLPSGERLESFQKNYVSTLFGIHWKVIDKTGSEKSTIGIAVSDINQPNASFLDGSKLSAMLVVEGSYRINYSKKRSYHVEVLHSQSKAMRSTLLGLRMNLNLYRFNSQLKGQYLHFFTKYRLLEGIVFGAIWERNNLSIGTSYDVPIGDRISHMGAFEIAVKYSKRRRPKRKRRKRRTNIRRIPKQADSDQIESLIEYPTTESVTEPTKESDENIEHKIDIKKPILLHFKFEFGSAEPVIEEQGMIEEISKILKNDPNMNISIIGHTDNVGSKVLNMGLSFERAESIFNLLVAMGVDPFQLTLDGKGEEEPISSNKTDRGRALNRRVEIRFLDQ